jgi:aspartate/methionine/tyrosine aminotransferase
MAERVSSFGTTIFTEMNVLAAEHNAVNLSQGMPDFAGPEFAKIAAIKAINADQNQYAPVPGILPLRKAAAANYARDYGVEADPATEVTVTCGASEAIFDIIMAMVNPGDEVIVFEPAYDAYIADIIMAGATPRYVTLLPPDNTANGQETASWTFDDAELRASFNSKTRAILVNTPHNPTGKVFTLAELQTIAELSKQHDVIVIADEVYDRLVFKGKHISIASLPGMWERTVTVNSAGKSFTVTGWKIGYAIAPAPLTDAIRRVHQFVNFAIATPLQAAVAEALEYASHSDHYNQLREFYAERRTLLIDILTKAGMDVAPHEGTYFLMADVRPWGFSDDVSFCRHLTIDVGVAAIPPSAFYADPKKAPVMARFCFAKNISTLQAAAEKLAASKVLVSPKV